MSQQLRTKTMIINIRFLGLRCVKIFFIDVNMAKCLPIGNYISTIIHPNIWRWSWGLNFGKSIVEKYHSYGNNLHSLQKIGLDPKRLKKATGETAAVAIEKPQLEPIRCRRLIQSSLPNSGQVYRWRGETPTILRYLLRTQMFSQ